MNLLCLDSPLLPRTFISSIVVVICGAVIRNLILVVICGAVIRNAQLSWCMGQKWRIGTWHIRMKRHPDLESLLHKSQSWPE